MKQSRPTQMSYGWPKFFIKFLRIMRLATLLLFIGCLQASATAYSQKTSLTLSLHDVSLKQAFTAIQQQSGYFFLYSNEKVMEAKEKVSIDLKNASIEEVMNVCLQGLPLSYKVVDETIIVMPAPDKPIEKPAAVLSALPAKEISGTVRDSATGDPLAGVTIKIQGGRIGTVTDAEGRFSLEVPDDNGILEVSYLGYAPKAIPVSGRETFDILLTAATTGLSQLVVVGYGTQKKENVTGAISVLDMSDRKNQPITNVSQAMHGIPGVWANMANGGKPGQDVASIKLRGIGTLNNSNPLVLVDGVEYNMNDVNPYFIKSVTVLKDASAAIYGSRAANGVILIQTKNGSKGKMKVNYNFSYGIQNPTRMPDVEWNAIKYMQLRNQAELNEGKNSVSYSDGLIAEYKEGMKTDPLAYPSTNWFDVIMKSGYLQQHNIRVYGGGDKATYSLGLGYMDQDGILINANHAKRYSLNLNLSMNVTDKLTVGGNVIGNYRKYTDPALTSGNDPMGFFFNLFMRAIPLYGTYLPDGRYANLAVPTPGRSGIENLMQYLNEGSNVHTAQRLLGKVFARYKLPVGFEYELNLAIDKTDGTADLFEPFMTTYNPQDWTPSYPIPEAYARGYFIRTIHPTIYQSLKWDGTIGHGHAINAMIGQSYEYYDIKTLTGSVRGYFDNTLTDLSVGALDPTATGSTSKDILASYFGRVDYSFRGKYLLDAIFRYDGSSRFAPENRWGFFPGISAGWRIDKEPFMQSISNKVNLLKLRASAGQMGNQQTVDLYGYMNTVSLNQDYNFNGKIVSGAAVTRVGNPNIAWESTTSYNVGLDALFFDHRLDLTVDVFKRRTSGILRTVEVAAQVGALAGPVMNVGTVDNKGYEVSLGYSNKIGQLSYRLKGNISYVNNKVVDLNGQTIPRGRRIIKEGYPIDAYYIYKAEGIYQTEEEVKNSATISNNVKPGYIKYADMDNNGVIDGDDRVIVGSSIPKYTYGFSLNAGFKGFEFNAFFQGVQGVDIYPTANLAFPFNNGAGVTKEWATESWTPDNPNARLPILTTTVGTQGENFNNSTFWLKDASYLRLKSIQLSYLLPEQWFSAAGIDNLNVFFNAENLFVLSELKNFDPEKNITQDNFYQYPMLKTYNFGVNVTF